MRIKLRDFINKNGRIFWLVAILVAFAIHHLFHSHELTLALLTLSIGFLLGLVTP